MTDQERQQAYLDAVKALSVQYGYELQAHIVTEQLGSAVLSKPQFALVPVEGWKSPAPEPNGKDSK